jgi:membrane-bound serine protease (ClpP class)
VSLPFIVSLALTSALIVFSMIAMALKARRRSVVSGSEYLIGVEGVVLADMQTQGWAQVQGERWQIISSAPLTRGQKVRVTRIDGLTLSVEPEQDGAAAQSGNV